ncbi:FAD-dependent oxidoreductase [Ammoniphilus sp. 3BR4]|uniref:GcvT family protein n=1 Tax=Ammoniphilus sp. 3BR4 TaxID=3158265 RepID=UPI003467B2EC
MTADRKIVIIGAGVVGVSTAYYLSKMGQRNITVLEQGPLVETGGSTSHAPGLVFQLNSSKTMTKLATDTVQCFSELTLDDQPCFYPVGSIEVAKTPERWEDLKRKSGLASSWGMRASLLSPEECATKYPFLDSTQIYGGLFVHSDGIAKPLRAVQAMTRFAEERGARFYGHTEVTGIEVEKGHVKAVKTNAGTFEADIVLCCAGFWGPRIGRMVNVTIPLQPMAHQYVFTSDLNELSQQTEEVAYPILRDQDSSMYFRQHFNSIGVGSYQHRAIPVEVDEIARYGESKDMPSVQPFTPEDFEKPWQDAIQLIPSLQNTEIKKGINGIFSFTPDGMSILGEAQNVRGFWVAEAVWVTHSAGVGKAMAEWIVDGISGVDLEVCDLNRFDSYAQSPAYYKSRSIESFEKVYDIHHPLMSDKSSREMRVSPYFSRQHELGAYFADSNGWEQPQWYEANAALVLARNLKIPDRTGWAGNYWSPIIGAEQLYTREKAALYDLTSTKMRIEISGEGALEYLQHLTTNKMDIPVGHGTYTLMLNEQAGIRGDLKVIRLEESKFLVFCSGPLEWDWMKRQLPLISSVQVRDLSPGTCSLAVIGPDAAQIMQSIASRDFAPEQWELSQGKEIYIDTVPVLAIYDSYFGETGWQFVAAHDQGLRLWDLLWEAGRAYGLIAAGDRALESLRLESGNPRYGKDFWSEHDPYEVGLDVAVDLGKADFIGKEALVQRKSKGPECCLATLFFDDPSHVVMGHEPVFDGKFAVGFISSADYGYGIGRSIAYAWLLPEAAQAGKVLTVEYFGQRYNVTVSVESVLVSG